MADQRDGQAFIAGATGATDAVHVVVATARHVEVDHQVQAVHVQAAGRHVGGHQNLGPALLHAVDGQLAVLLVLVAVQHEHFVLGGHQLAVQTVGLHLGVGEDDRLVVGLVGQQPVHQTLFVVVVVGGDDLLTGAFVELANAVELQVQRIAQHAANHFAQAGTAGGGGEQHGLLTVAALTGQTLHVLGKAHVEHAVGFVEDQHFNVIQFQVAGVQLFEHPPRGADQDVRHLAQHGGLHLEVFTAGDHPRLDKGELGEALDFLEGLLGQLAGRQQDQRTDGDALLARAHQAVEQRQHERSGLAAAGLRGYPQVTPFQRRRNGRCLDRGWLDKFKLGHGFQQTFMQGELGKHG